ncbi:hypothetical protein [Pseudovibrio sp. Ad26]|uniref:hypothetical protein n=1 Tax=Pseudovibrio sp. Ad26 TaxID=989410 RepID=UPI0007AE9A9A|nr:hypothetical protein [Pseudovibrio sp. Ad26]
MDLAPRRKKAPPSFPVTNLLPRSDRELEITLKRLLNAQKIIAPLIAAGNTKYLSIFQRLKREIEEFQQRKDDPALALRIAKDD